MNLLKELTRVCREDVNKARWRAHVAICESKKRFATKKLAKMKCDEIIAQGGEPTIRPYLCKTCKEFHLSRN